jgi:hypothetical protein
MDAYTPAENDRLFGLLRSYNANSRTTTSSDSRLVAWLEWDEWSRLPHWSGQSDGLRMSWWDAYFTALTTSRQWDRLWNMYWREDRRTSGLNYPVSRSETTRAAKYVAEDARIMRVSDKLATHLWPQIVRLMQTHPTADLGGQDPTHWMWERFLTYADNAQKKILGRHTRPGSGSGAVEWTDH